MAKMFDGTLVKLLHGNDFQDKEPWKLRDGRCTFILFFAEWCGHCRNLKPEYIKFADIAQFMHVRAVDTEEEKELMEKLSNKKSPVQVKGYPTIWIYSKGEPYREYDGPRTWQGLLTEAQKVCNEGCSCA